MKIKYIASLLVVLLSTLVTLFTPFIANAVVNDFSDPRLVNKVYIGNSTTNQCFSDVTNNYMQYFTQAYPSISWSTKFDPSVNYWVISQSVSSTGNYSIHITVLPKSMTNYASYGYNYDNQTDSALNVGYYVDMNDVWQHETYGVRISDLNDCNSIQTYESGVGQLTYQGPRWTDDYIKTQSPPYTDPTSPGIVSLFERHYSPGSAYSMLYISTVPFQQPNNGSGTAPEPSPGDDGRQIVYPGMSVIVEDNGADSDTSKVKLIFADSWSDFLNTSGLSPPDYSIFTLTDMEDNVIVSDRCWGPTGCDWNELPLGSYKARLDVIYLNEEINASYEFKTTEVWFEVNNTSYTMLYNSNEDKYCSVRNGYEWNCTIPQPGDEPELITGDPEAWLEEECTKEAFPWIDLGACIRNGLHYLGEYLGINGPSITSGSSAFFQFDTNTFGLTSILTAPITILNNLAGAEYTCSTVNLPLPYMSDDLELPCMNAYYTTYLGDLYTLWQTVINGIVSYFVIVGILRMVKDAKDPQKDKIEVLAL